MTTFTNSEGRVLTFTNELLETMLLQLNSSNNYYTPGEHDIISFIKIGSNTLLDHTYHINRNILQNYTINWNLINNYDLCFILYWTSNEYDLQAIYKCNGLIGIITELSQVYLATYDTHAQPFVYACSENIDITDNQLSLIFTIKIINEIVLNPRAYDNAVFEMIYGTGIFCFSAKHNPWRTATSSSLFINGSMHIS